MVRLAPTLCTVAAFSILSVASLPVQKSSQLDVSGRSIDAVQQRANMISAQYDSRSLEVGSRAVDTDSTLLEARQLLERLQQSGDLVARGVDSDPTQRSGDLEARKPPHPEHPHHEHRTVRRAVDSDSTLLDARQSLDTLDLVARNKHHEHEHHEHDKHGKHEKHGHEKHHPHDAAARRAVDSDPTLLEARQLLDKLEQDLIAREVAEHHDDHEHHTVRAVGLDST